MNDSSATTDPKGHKKECCWTHHSATIARASVSDAFLGICQLCYRCYLGEFLCQSWSSHQFLCVGVCSDFRSQWGYQWRFSHWDLHHCNPFEHNHAVICATWCWPVTHTKSGLNGCSLHCFEYGRASHYSTVLQPFFNMVGIQLLEISRIMWYLCLHYMSGRDFVFLAVLHPVTQSTLNLWWALNLVILVLWLVNWLMNLCAPDWQIILLLDNTFMLGSWTRCQHYPTSKFNQGVRITLFF